MCTDLASIAEERVPQFALTDVHRRLTLKLTKKLNVTAHAFSKSARKKIEAAGGTVTVIDTPQTEEAPKAKTAKTAE